MSDDAVILQCFYRATFEFEMGAWFAYDVFCLLLTEYKMPKEIEPVCFDRLQELGMLNMSGELTQRGLDMKHFLSI